MQFLPHLLAQLVNGWRIQLALPQLSKITGSLARAPCVATTRSEVTMRFGGTAAPIVYVSAGQVSYHVAGKATVQMTPEYQGRVSAPVTLQLRRASRAGERGGAVWHGVIRPAASVAVTVGGRATTDLVRKVTGT